MEYSVLFCLRGFSNNVKTLNVRGISHRLPFTKMEERDMIKMDPFPFLTSWPSLSHLTTYGSKFELDVDKQGTGT